MSKLIEVREWTLFFDDVAQEGYIRTKGDYEDAHNGECVNVIEAEPVLARIRELEAENSELKDDWQKERYQAAVLMENDELKSQLAKRDEVIEAQEAAIKVLRGALDRIGQCISFGVEPRLKVVNEALEKADALLAEPK